MIVTMSIIDGKKIADGILNKLKTQRSPESFLAAVLVGNPSTGSGQASASFIKQKEKTAKELGVDFRVCNFPADINESSLRDEVSKISRDVNCSGVLVQLPLPEHINKHYVLNAIPREKDVDVLGEEALGTFYEGRNPILPPSVGTLSEILSAVNFTLSSAKVAVVGLGFLVGKPISVWLEGNPEKSQSDLGARCKELFLLDKGSDFLILREADLVITGVGSAGMIKSDMLKVEATVIDFGYDSSTTLTTSNGRGDFDSSSIQHSAFSINNLTYTPTPGGTGPILVAKLLENFYILSKNFSS